MIRLIPFALIVAAVGPSPAGAIPRGFTSPPSKLFLTCPIEPENFDRRSLSQRGA